MSPRLKELYEEKRKAIDRMKAISAIVEERKGTPELRKEFDDAGKLVDSLNDSISVLQRHADIELGKEAASAKKVDYSEDENDEDHLLRSARGSAVAVFANGDKRSVRKYYEAKTDSKGSKGMHIGKIMRIHQTGPQNEAEERAMSEGTPSAGGYTVDSVVSADFIDRLRPATTCIRAGARTITFDGTNSYNMAKLTTGLTAEWKAENASQSAADMAFGNVQFAPKTLRALIKISRELFEDSLNIENILAQEATRAFAAELDRVALVGSGTGSEPQGIANYTSAPFIWSGANGEAPSDYDKILSLVYELQANNTNVDGNSAAIMHPRTLQAMNALKSGIDYQPLRRPDYIKDQPWYQTTSIGITDSYGSSNAASKLFIGDWSQLVFGIRNQVQIIPLPTLYAENNQIGFLIAMRADVKPLHEQSLGFVKGILGGSDLLT